MKRKDNLTDLVEHVQEHEAAEDSNPSLKPWQVVDENGEIITLGQTFAEKVVKKLNSDQG